MKKLLLLSLFIFISVISNAQTFTELVVPKYMASKTAASTNNARIGIAFCVSISGLLPNTTYDISAGIGLTTDLATSFGAGNIWNGAAFSGSRLNNAFTTDAFGQTGPIWFFMQATGNGSRFGGGATHNLRLAVITSTGTMPGSPQFVGTKTITGLDIAATALTGATTDDGAFIYGQANSDAAGKYVLIYDNIAGTGDPLYSFRVVAPNTIGGFSTFAQSELVNVSFNSTNNINQVIWVNSISGLPYGSIGEFVGVIPIGANNPNGVQRIEARNPDNTIYAFNTDADGVWGSGANSTTATRRGVVVLTNLDAPLSTIIGVPSSANSITGFTIPSQVGSTTISGNNIAVLMPFGTNLTSLAPTITISPLATVSPNTGVARDF
ncbi:MAG: hypothetical protein SFY32_12795, partial [Bacteroidota bacterium]|nr:hypothetical protein [Bacteroidota bacterium]